MILILRYKKNQFHSTICPYKIIEYGDKSSNCTARINTFIVFLGKCNRDFLVRDSYFFTECNQDELDCETLRPLNGCMILIIRVFSPGYKRDKSS